MTRSIRIRLRRAIGLGLALGVVIAPNALAKPFIGDSSGSPTPSQSNAYSFYRPAKPQATYYDAWRVPAVTSAGVGSIALTHDTWGRDIRTSSVGVTPRASSSTFHDSWGSDVLSSGAARQSTAVNAGSSSDDTRNVLLAASGLGVLLVGGSSLVLMLRRRRGDAQLA